MRFVEESALGIDLTSSNVDLAHLAYRIRNDQKKKSRLLQQKHAFCKI
jgi:hypothetical protein